MALSLFPCVEWAGTKTNETFTILTGPTTVKPAKAITVPAGSKTVVSAETKISLLETVEDDVVWRLLHLGASGIRHSPYHNFPYFRHASRTVYTTRTVVSIALSKQAPIYRQRS